MKANIAPVRSIFFTIRLPASLIMFRRGRLVAVNCLFEKVAMYATQSDWPHASRKADRRHASRVLRNTVPPELHRLPEPASLRSFKRIVRAPRKGEVA